ncbi:MAG: UDP-N-acetylmuramate dehydrogenase [Parachlamydiales bacterium]|nr:UDP-N-acetylmuramate dehydrogenase [Parachlamydiales bacterium]
MIQENVELKPYSSFKIGGKARYYVVVENKEALKEAFLFAKKKGIFFKVLGRGSNILFDDRGFSGLIIHNHIRDCSIDPTCVRVGSGYNISKLALETSKKNLLGLQFAYLLPASVGGAVYMNASAFDQKISSIFVEASYMHEDGTEQTMTSKEVEFGYRFSSFQKRTGAIIDVTFSLQSSLECLALLEEYARRRKETQPLDAWSCGCVFKNPPNVAAAYLIDQANLKGISIGGAQVSQKHANFIVNTGNATAGHVEELVKLIRKKVYKSTGIFLEAEMVKFPYEKE